MISVPHCNSFTLGKKLSKENNNSSSFMKISSGFNIHNYITKYKLLNTPHYGKSSFLKNALININSHKHSSLFNKHLFNHSPNEKHNISEHSFTKTKSTFLKSHSTSFPYKIINDTSNRSIHNSSSVFSENKPPLLKSISPSKRITNRNAFSLPPAITPPSLKKPKISLLKSTSILKHHIHMNKNNIIKNSKHPLRLIDKSSPHIHNTSSIMKHYSFISQPGTLESGKIKTNQDYVIIKTNINNIIDFNIFAVLDGHGENGHLVSQFAAKYITSKMMHSKQIKRCTNLKEVYYEFQYNNYEIVKKIFNHAESELRKQEYDCDYSGTTCCMLIQIGNVLLCANTGDSRSILIKKELNKMCSYSSVAMSIDHKPDCDNERKRIEHFNGRVEQVKECGVHTGPYRVWVKEGNYPGLAVSRSIGDWIARDLGVIADPEIREFILDESCKYVVMGSDGLWEFVDGKDAVKVSKKYYEEEDAEKMCDALVKEAMKCWMEEENVMDDISVVVVMFKGI